MNSSRSILAVLVLSSTTLQLQADDILEAGAKPTHVLKQGAGEGPAWHPKLGLLFSGPGGIGRYDRDGKLSVHRKDAGTNGLLFDSKGGLISCEPVYRRVGYAAPDGTYKILTDNYQGKKYNQPNDIAVDSKGRIYFSDPRYGSRDGMEIKDDDGKLVEGVYRIDPNGKVTRIITHEADRPNGLLVTPDDRFLYVADNNNSDVGGARKLWRFRLKDDGTIRVQSRKLIFDWKNGRGPDGMVMDQKGNLFVAGGLNKAHPPAETAEFAGGVYIFSPKGQLVKVIPIPNDEVTNCTFGGDDLKTLYITAGGNLWSVRVKTPGKLPWPVIK
jgi:gluconolactonase